MLPKLPQVTSVLPNDAWTLTANAGLLAHCIVAYMVRLLWHSFGEDP